MIWDFMQNDPRWADHPYSVPGGTLADSGCGVAAISDLTGVLPPIVADYMTERGYAAPYGQGTYWTAIIPTCEHYGHSGLQLNGSDLYGQRNTETERRWLEAMRSGQWYGCLLMGKGYFTQGGHFIAVESVDEHNNCKCYDPAWSVRSGWHPWADYYQGCVKVFYLIEKDTRGVYDMQLETVYEGCTGLSVLVCQKMLACCGLYSGGFDGSAGAKTRQAIIDFQTILTNEGKDVGGINGVCGEKTWKELVERHS